MKHCQQCQANNRDDAVFCAYCGIALAESTAPLSAPLQPPELLPRESPPAPSASRALAAAPATQPPSPGHPRVVVAASGAYFDISHCAQVVIGRVDPISGTAPEIDLTEHGADEGGISRQHCRIILADNQYLAEDLSSRNGTWIGSTRLPPNARTPLKHGDQIRLGKLILNFFAS